MTGAPRIYGDWDDAAALKRAKRGGLDVDRLQRVFIKVRGTHGGDYLVRGHIAPDQWERWHGISKRRDGKMQMSLGPSPQGYRIGENCEAAGADAAPPASKLPRP